MAEICIKGRMILEDLRVGKYKDQDCLNHLLSRLESMEGEMEACDRELERLMHR
jgi:hypothetical protein